MYSPHCLIHQFEEHITMQAMWPVKRGFCVFQGIPRVKQEHLNKTWAGDPVRYSHEAIRLGSPTPIADLCAHLSLADLYAVISHTQSIYRSLYKLKRWANAAASGPKQTSFSYLKDLYGFIVYNFCVPKCLILVVFCTRRVGLCFASCGSFLWFHFASWAKLPKSLSYYKAGAPYDIDTSPAYPSAFWCYTSFDFLFTVVNKLKWLQQMNIMHRANHRTFPSWWSHDKPSSSTIHG